MEAEAVNNFFSPALYILVLGTLVVGWVVMLQWTWAKTCRENVLVLVERIKGNGDWMLAPIAGSSITLPNTKGEGTQVWGINELSCIGVPYPGVAFIPKFLQKEIRLVVVSEETWEPITNRSIDRELVCSPAFFGNVINEKITEAVVTVSKEFMDMVKGLGNLLSPKHYYIGTGVTLIILVVVLYRMVELSKEIEILKTGLGL